MDFVRIKAMTRGALAFAILLAASPASSASSPWSEKAYGVLLVGPDGGHDWAAFIAQVKKRLGPDIPIESFAGPLESRSLQKAVDRLSSARARKICVIPVFPYTASMELDQLRYTLGLEKLPSRLFLEAWGMTRRVVTRVKTKAALVLTAPLGSDEAASSALLERALENRRRGRDATVLLLGSGAETDNENAARLADLEAHAKRLGASKDLAGARVWLLRPNSKDRPRQRAESEKALQVLVAGLTRAGPVVIVPYLLTQDGTLRAWRRVLENPFLRWQEKGLLPSDRLARWAAERASAARGEADQVRFKDAGQALPPEERKR